VQNSTVTLALEADDPPMAGHVLRAMAHQAVDLGNAQQALDLATASVDGQRYALASPRERALLGVMYARSLAATRQKHAAATALILAENDLAAAEPGNEEPDRVFLFGEASLAHETRAHYVTPGTYRALYRSSLAASAPAMRQRSLARTP
jgi:hypothetical protein